ncbi:MAG: hypothetical protein ACFB15_04010 [Cyclobacteriaceae bacterium]
MKKLLFIVLWLVSFNLYSQDTPLVYVESFFENLAPCGAPVFCYKYALQVEPGHLILITELCNYAGDPKEPVLTEKTTYKIPIKKLKGVDYFSYDGTDIYISTYNLDIEKRQNGQTEYVDFIPIDFNKYQLNQERKQDLQKHLNALIRSLQ